MRRAFDRAVQFTLDHEGGYVDDPDDPGGETNFGISKRQYPAIDIRALTRNDAEQIYRRDYWKANSCDQMPPLTAMAVFDWCVHSPTQTVIHALQKSVRRRPDHWLVLDGLMGPRTLDALNTFVTSSTLDSVVALGMVEKRLLFLARLIQRAPERRLKYLRGWMKRCFWQGVAIMEGQIELSE